MKKNLTFNPPIITSTESKMNVDSFDTSVDAFDNKEYLNSFYALLDYINPEFRTKYGNAEGTEFNIPHGSIIVNIKLEDNQLKVMAPFVAIPENGRIPLLRQVAVLNFNNMDLARVLMKDNLLNFEYSCPIELVNPYKIYYVLEEICLTGDKYDDEFATKFGAERIYEPKVTPYSQEEMDSIYEAIQLSCNECLDAVKHFEGLRKYGFAWNIIAITFYKILYCIHPQGQLMNDLHKYVREHDREDIPLPEIVAHGKGIIENLKATPKEKLAEDLYYVETFIPAKRRSNLKNIQENFEDDAEKAESYFDQDDYLSCSIIILYQFYRLYYYNNVQDDVNAVVARSLANSSGKPWEEAAPILMAAMNSIMEGNLEVPAASYMDEIQQAMKNLNMGAVAENLKNIMGSMFGGGKK